MCIYIVAVPARAPRTVTAERRSLLSAIQQDDCCRPVNKVAIHPGTGSQDLNNRATKTMEKLGICLVQSHRQRKASVRARAQAWHRAISAGAQAQRLPRQLEGVRSPV